MSTLAWVLIGAAFLTLVMVANNSWSAIWSRLSGASSASAPVVIPVDPITTTVDSLTQAGGVIVSAVTNSAGNLQTTVRTPDGLTHIITAP